MKAKLVMHTKMSGEIALSIIDKNVKLAEVALGTSPKLAREKAKQIVDAVRGVDDITDERELLLRCLCGECDFDEYLDQWADVC